MCELLTNGFRQVDSQVVSKFNQVNGDVSNLMCDFRLFLASDCEALSGGTSLEMFQQFIRLDGY